MHVHRGPVAKRARLVGEHANASVDPRRGIGNRTGDDPVPAPDRVLLEPGAREVDRASVAGQTARCFGILSMDGARATGGSGGEHADRVAARELSGKDGAGDHQSGAGDGEGPIDREPEIAGGRAARQVPGDARSRAPSSATP